MWELGTRLAGDLGLSAIQVVNDSSQTRARARAPHPSPLPKGEGTDRAILSKYTDLKYRVELRF
ncbi:hypothetical protein PkoCFBP13504_07590 [Pseudomonas koreensis]|nr:hypothetical protein PkoCFBP13504_07590 [Pseudomonas koreensis]